MVQFTRSFFSLCLIAASFAGPTKRTVAQIEADVADISAQVTALDNAIKGLPASGLAGALAIAAGMGLLDTALNTGTSDMKATGPLDEADATTILSSVEAIEPVFTNALTTLTAEEPTLAALPVGGTPAFILSYLRALNASTAAFVNTSIAVVPASLQGEATSILSSLIAAFAPAIEAFS